MSNFVKYENISSLVQKIADKLRNVGAIMDDAFSDSSTNGVQNKVIKSALDTIGTALSGKSDTGHKHSADDITSGTLAVTRGGTGNTSVDTAPTSESTKMCTSGGIYTALSGKSDTGHKHSAADITSGTLAVARGGTGNTSVDTTPTSGSTKMCTSGGILTALNGKQATLTVTSGTATANTSKATWQVTPRYRKYGRIVQVTAMITGFSDTTSTYVDIITGLPAPAMDAEFSFAPHFSGDSTFPAMGCYFTTSGILRAYERENNKGYRISFCYISAS